MMSGSEDSPSKILAQPLAIGLGAALLLGYAVITAFAIYDKAHRDSIERVSGAYAVGDKNYFPKTFDKGAPLVNFSGHSLYYADHVSEADSSMLRAGMDDSNVYAIYNLTTATGAEVAFVYLKVGENDYIKAERRK